MTGKAAEAGADFFIIIIFLMPLATVHGHGLFLLTRLQTDYSVLNLACFNLGLVTVQYDEATKVGDLLITDPFSLVSHDILVNYPVSVTENSLVHPM